MLSRMENKRSGGWLLLTWLWASSPVQAQVSTELRVGEAVTAAPDQAAQPTAPAVLLSENTPVRQSANADYEAALTQALEAHARGDYGHARIFLERAHSLEPSARTWRGLGIVAFAQGRHLEAIRFLDAALASDVKPLPPELRAGVEELLVNAWGQVGRFEILLEPNTGDFLIDRQAPDFYAPSTVVLTPGSHRIVARAPERAEFELPLEVKAGDHRTLQIVLARPPHPVTVERIVPAESRSALKEAKRRGLWIGGGALIAAAGTVYGVAYLRLQDIVTHCRDEAGGGCTQRRATKLYRGENIEGLAITSGVLAGAGVVTWLTAAAYELWTRKGSRADTRAEKRARLQLSPTSFAVSGRF